MMNFKLNNFIRVKIYSRFCNTKHQVFIVYQKNIIEENNDNVISGYYCTCQSETRTLGTCAQNRRIIQKTRSIIDLANEGKIRG